ncbi:cyclodeaminase/cyclohydrolase family protein [Thermomicrobium sp.]
MLDREGSIADWTVSQLVERMRRPRYRCGGGVAACLSIAQAAALTDLVRRAAKQQLPREVADTLAEDLERIAVSALAQAERDREALDGLLRTLRLDQGSPSAAVAAERASAVPLETADLGLALAALIRSVLPHTPPFAASDLEAAQALCRAGIEAALAMARANLPLLSPERAEVLQREIFQRRGRLSEHAQA